MRRIAAASIAVPQKYNAAEANDPSLGVLIPLLLNAPRKGAANAKSSFEETSLAPSCFQGKLQLICGFHPKGSSACAGSSGLE
jgi:hypothetical protein